MASKAEFEEELDSIQHLMDIERIGNRAVKQAQAENRLLGIPNYYSINGQIISDSSEAAIDTKDEQ